MKSLEEKYILVLILLLDPSVNMETVVTPFNNSYFKIFEDDFWVLVSRIILDFSILVRV